jgi:hypothetical protein
MKRAILIALAVNTSVLAYGSSPDLSVTPDSPVFGEQRVSGGPSLYRVKRRIVVARDGAVDAPCDPDSEIINIQLGGRELAVTRMGVKSVFGIASRDPVAMWDNGSPKLVGAYRGIRAMPDGAVEQIVVTEDTLTIVTTGSALQTVTTVFASRITNPTPKEIAWTKEQP